MDKKKLLGKKGIVYHKKMNSLRSTTGQIVHLLSLPTINTQNKWSEHLDSYVSYYIYINFIMEHRTVNYNNAQN